MTHVAEVRLKLKSIYHIYNYFPSIPRIFGPSLWTYLNLTWSICPLHLEMAAYDNYQLAMWVIIKVHIYKASPKKYAYVCIFM